MKIRTGFLRHLGIVTLAALAPTAYADTTWISTSSQIFSTAGNWNNGLPSTGPQLAIFADSASIQHAIDLQGVTARNSLGITFNSFSGGAGFVFNSTTANSPGFQNRAGGTANGIVNNDDSTQTFNVSMYLFSNSGIVGAGAAQTFNAAAGNLVFSGNHPTGRSTVNNNGGNLTIDGAFNTTIGISGATFGDLIGTGGLIKNGAGILTLGGTAANTFSGGTTINQGKIVAAKANALNTGNLLMNGGTFDTGGLNQAFGAGTLGLTASSLIDFGAGTTTLSLANSSALTWAGFLDVANYTPGSDLFRIGTDSTGLTADQLLEIRFVDFDNAPGQIDANGFITPVAVPEPSTVALGVLGLGLGWFIRKRK